jgi:hypothetical protein
MEISDHFEFSIGSIADISKIIKAKDIIDGILIEQTVKQLEVIND